MKLWVLRSALRAAVHKIRFPCIRIRSSSWSNGDHTHFCYALRILETDDFLAVCPLNKCKKRFDPEHEDECDRCKYFGGVDFFKKDGEKVGFW